jgi:tRNA nucleotidyltransferase/poly(A) polymerase
MNKTGERMVFTMGFSSEPCAQLLLDEGLWAYYCTETARDMLLRRSPTTINILTNADLIQLHRLFPDLSLNGERRESAFLDRDGVRVRFHLSDYPIYRSVQIPGMLEVEKDALKLAAEHELFRINGFFYNIISEVFHDPLDSFRQLRDGLIQTVQPLELAAREHPTIALETAKLYSETGFVLDERLNEFLGEADTPSLYSRPDRNVVMSFIDAFSSKRADWVLTLLDRWGVLTQLLPEVSRLKNVGHDKDHHPEGDAFHHTLRCLKCVKKPNPNLMFAILLHDTGKATTMSGGNGFRFPKHSLESRRIAERVLHRFGIDEQDREEILFLVQNHMLLNDIERRPESFQKRIFSSPFFPNLLELYRADIESTFTHVRSYYHVARLYRRLMKKQRLQEQGVYAHARQARL